MDKGERITVRLSEEDMALLSELVRRGEYKFESDVVNDAIRSFLDTRFSEAEKEKVLEDRSRIKHLDLNDFISGEEDADKILVNVIARGLESERKEDRCRRRSSSVSADTGAGVSRPMPASNPRSLCS